MPVAAAFLLFVILLIAAARLLLHTQRRPSVLPDEDSTGGFRDPSPRAD